MDNPKLLWSHLKIPVRNLFFERYVITKQLIRQIRKGKEKNLSQCISCVERQNSNSHFIKFVKEKLVGISKEDFSKVENFSSHMKKIIKHIFHNWFFQKFGGVNQVQVQTPIEDSQPLSQKKLKTLDNFFD